MTNEVPVPVPVGVHQQRPCEATTSLSSPMASQYFAREVESWDPRWQSVSLCEPQLCLSDYDRPATTQSSSGSDDSTASTDTGPPSLRFIMIMPPANATSTLDMDRALACSVQDGLARWNRACGRETLWIPTIDHSGMAAQTLVEELLVGRTGQRPTRLSHADVLQLVRSWQGGQSSSTKEHMHWLGVSADWSRERSTMDDGYSTAVQHAFVRLYEQGRIYRAEKLVNWSCALKTAISQVDVDYISITQPTLLCIPGVGHRVQFGVLHTFAYPLIPLAGEDDHGEALLVSTTRMETLFDDVAVAVHPNDARYVRFHGRQVQHPLLPYRSLPVICDAALVNMGVGGGVVKVTPAHDQADFHCAQRHNLPLLNIFNDDGTMNEQAGPYQGPALLRLPRAGDPALECQGAVQRMGGEPDEVGPVCPQWRRRRADAASAVVDGLRRAGEASNGCSR